mmetsp:Transcript_16805/g.38680  ORF Transcript_16805/g.38680 Transcript_16805/m.38680 type:complete len:109 (+) Transcript_16805:278-604(+)
MQLLDFRCGGQAKQKKKKKNDGEEEGKRGLSSLIRCPISGNIMVDPVVAADGHIYERLVIQEYFVRAREDGNQQVVSLVTGEPLVHCLLVPSVAVKDVAAQYIRESGA